jgi:hypothetical protein
MKMRSACAIALSLITTISAGAEHTLPPGADPRQVAQELVEKLRSSTPPENTHVTGFLKILAKNSDMRSVPIEFEVKVGKDSWRAIYRTFMGTTAPPETAVIVHYRDRTNEYLFARGTNAHPKLLSRAEAARSIGGSDFSLIDLGLDFLHWPVQRIIKTEMRKGRWCNVLESVQPNPPAGSYARVLSWLDKETGGPILAEAYDSSDKLLKEFSIKALKKIEGEWQLKEMQIINVKTRSRTRLEFDLKVAADTRE